MRHKRGRPPRSGTKARVKWGAGHRRIARLERRFTREMMTMAGMPFEMAPPVKNILITDLAGEP